MPDVRIADLKAHLSEHLRTVRAGRTLTVLDRDTPIARIVPVRAGHVMLAIRPARPGAPRLADVPLPPPLRRKGDIVDLLLAERQGSR
jgi:antitoxin (DNA-binding transcriptional repressor) of toxin-antitoxin stability system